MEKKSGLRGIAGRMLIVSFAIMCLATASLAFTGESAAAKAMLDLLLRKNFKAVGVELVEYLMDLCRTYLLPLLLLNPNPMNPTVLGITRYITSIMGVLFVSAVIFSGIYLIFFSGSPGVRSRIKTLLPGVVAAMILVTLSSHIINVVFYVSNTICSSIITQWRVNPVDVLLPGDESINPIAYFMSNFSNITWYSAEAAAPFLFIAILLLGGLFAVIAARYLILSLFVIVFPLTIFLYLFLPTRGIGRRMMEQTILWTFLQVIEALTLVSVTAVISMFTSLLAVELLIFLEIGGLLVLIAVPVAAIFLFRDFLPG